VGVVFGWGRCGAEVAVISFCLCAFFKRGVLLGWWCWGFGVAVISLVLWVCLVGGVLCGVVVLVSWGCRDFVGFVGVFGGWCVVWGDDAWVLGLP
jgi:hypothetical protein